tara:strand:- start:2162 stop:2557 length:396 start_codon:yes stop_codon:yes gene_type:complete
MKNINEQIKRMKNLMGIVEAESHNNFNDMYINSKSISRGGVIYQEQGLTDTPNPVSTVRDAEISNNIELNKQKEMERQQHVMKKKIEDDEIKKREEEIEKLEKQKKEAEQEAEQEKKNNELEARLQKQRTT